MKLKNNTRYFWYVSIFVLLLVLVIKLVQLSKMIYFYPSYDFSSHIANLFFLKEYGFHGISPNWYDGFVVLGNYPPLLFFFSYVFYNFISNVQLAFYISFIGIIVLGFFGINFLGKVLNFSMIKRLFLFLFFYANPLTIPWFYIIGRIPEMLAWTMFFYLLGILFYYKNRKLDTKFYIFLIIILSLILLSHPLVLALSLFLVFGLFLIKKEKIKIIVPLTVVPLITSFWLLDFIKNIGNLSYTPSYRLYSHPTEVIYSILIPLVFIGIFYLYKKVKKIDKKDILFYSPLFLISILYLTNLFLYIPGLKSIEPRTYGILLMFMSMIFIFDLKSKKALKLISIGILVLSLIITVIAFTRYDNIDFPLYSEQEIGAINLTSLVNEKFIAIGKNGDVNKRHVYAYGAVNHNLTTPLGWGIEQASEEINKIEEEIKGSINEENCNKFNEIMNEMKVKELIVHKNKCEFIKTCDFIEKETSGQYCLFTKN